MAVIMIIDDEEDLRKMLRMAFDREGHQVVEVPTGRTALEEFENCRPDLVITDIFMPEKDGIETILDLKEAYPDCKIIAYSGGGEMGVGTRYTLESARDFGAERVFAKPLNLQSFMEAVEELLAE